MFGRRVSAKEEDATELESESGHDPDLDLDLDLDPAPDRAPVTHIEAEVRSWPVSFISEFFAFEAAADSVEVVG